MSPAEQVQRDAASRHLAKAGQFLRAARHSLSEQDFDASVSAAVLAGIASADAYVVHRHGVRARGKDHGTAVDDLRAHGGRGVSEQAEQLAKLIRRKSAAQYGDRLSTEREAREAFARAERLVAWARDGLKGATR